MQVRSPKAWRLRSRRGRRRRSLTPPLVFIRRLRKSSLLCVNRWNNRNRGGLPVTSSRQAPRLLGRFFLLSRSEEHTSELQSRENLVCRLLLEKKKLKSSTMIRSSKHTI